MRLGEGCSARFIYLAPKRLMAFNTEFRAKEDRIEEIEPGFSLTEFLSSPYLDTIAQTIEREYYAREVSRFHYPVILMPKHHMI